MRAILGIFGVMLSACGGAGTSTNFEDVGATVDDIRLGTADGAVGQNGLAFASETSDTRALEQREVAIKVVRFTRDRDTREPTLLITTETVTLPDQFYARSFAPSVFTLDGVTYDLSEASDNGAGIYYNHRDTEFGGGSDHVNAHQIYFAESGSVDTFWEWAHFVVGHETDPTVVALQTGTTSYSGRFNIQTFPSYNGGAHSDLYRPFNGTMNLDVDFDEGKVNGTFSAFVQPFEPLLLWEDNVSGIITQTDLEGNGFGTTMLITDCVDMASCTSENTLIGGALYGPDADRVGGIIMLDATFTNDEGDETRLIGPGVFTIDPLSD